MKEMKLIESIKYLLYSSIHILLLNKNNINYIKVKMNILIKNNIIIFKKCQEDIMHLPQQIQHMVVFT
jgi:hypothetical protein